MISIYVLTAKCNHESFNEKFLKVECGNVSNVDGEEKASENREIKRLKQRETEGEKERGREKEGKGKRRKRKRNIGLLAPSGP